MTAKDPSKKTRALLASVALFGLVLTGGGVTSAYFTATSSLADNSASTSTLGAPTGLVADWRSNGSSALSWNAPTDQTWARANGVTSGIDYTVQRTYPGQTPTTVYKGSDTAYIDPAQPQTALQFTQVSSGNGHTIGVAEDGTVWGWGGNSDGQLGDGTKTDRALPVKAILPAKAVQVEAGGFYSLALLDNNTVYAWGWNEYGEMGDGTRVGRPTPVKVKLPEGVVIKSLGTLSPQSHTNFAITSDNKLYGWGYNVYGETGNGRSGNGSYVSTPALSAYSFSAMASGQGYVTGIDPDGKVWAWGAGASYSLGNGSTANRTSPRAVSMPADVRVVQIAAGSAFGVARDEAGQAYTWGSVMTNMNTDRVRSTPALMNTLDSATTGVYAGEEFACALLVGSEQYCWGVNDYRQLQDGTTIDRATPVRSWSARSFPLISLALGSSTSFAVAAPSVDNSGTNIWAWGPNQNGQRGDGRTTAGAPSQVKGPVGCAEGTVSDGAGTCVAKSGTTYTLTYLFRSWLSPASTVTK